MIRLVGDETEFDAKLYFTYPYADKIEIHICNLTKNDIVRYQEGNILCSQSGSEGEIYHRTWEQARLVHLRNLTRRKKKADAESKKTQQLIEELIDSQPNEIVEK